MVVKENMSLRYSAFMCKTFILKWNLQTFHGGLSKASYVITAMSHIGVVFLWEAACRSEVSLFK